MAVAYGKVDMIGNAPWYEAALGTILKALVEPSRATMRRSLFGKPKPTAKQVGYVFGMAEAYWRASPENHLGMEDTILAALLYAYGELGRTLIMRWPAGNPAFMSGTLLGEAGFHSWMSTSKVPMPPLR